MHGGGIVERTSITEFVLRTIVQTTIILALVCSFANAQSRNGAEPRPNTLSSAEQRDGWRLLFDGRTLAGWRGLGYDSVPTAHWKVVDGAIEKIATGNVRKMPDGQRANGGDLMTWTRSPTSSSRSSGK